MDTYFARHTSELDIDQNTRNILWENDLIAIHFPQQKGVLQGSDNRSLDPNDYDFSGRKAINALNRLADQGGYVCAQYHGFDDIKVGRVKEHSSIILLEGKWGNANKLEGRMAVLKTLKLSNVRHIKPYEYAYINVGRPRQGTLMRWHSVGERIKNIVEKRACAVEFENLFPSQQEIMCCEFLRTSVAVTMSLPVLESLTLPIGRTMKDIDFMGVSSDGKPIIAQVTHLPIERSQWKIDQLQKYADPSGSHLLLFCDCDGISAVGVITTIPIKQVYAKFIDTDKGKRWLSNSMGTV